VLIARGDALGVVLRRASGSGGRRFTIVFTVTHAHGEPDRVPDTDCDAHGDPATHSRADSGPDRRHDDPVDQARPRAGRPLL